MCINISSSNALAQAEAAARDPAPGAGSAIQEPGPPREVRPRHTRQRRRQSTVNAHYSS